MALANKGFETAGASAGLAASWTSSFVATAEAYPDFSGGVGAASPVEDFSWSEFVETFAPGDTDVAVFGTGALATVVESFESEWSADYFTFEISSAESAMFSDARNYDQFSWSTLVVGFGPGDTAVASFTGGGAAEDFDVTGWIGQIGSSSNASFGHGATFESFEEMLGVFFFTVDPATNIFTSAGINLQVGSAIRFAGPGLPTSTPGLAEGITYYALNCTLNTFTVSTALVGGTQIDVTGAAGSLATVFGDPTIYFNERF